MDERDHKPTKMKEIKKGQTYLCIKDVLMDCGETVFTKGKTYLCEFDNVLTNNIGGQHGCSNYRGWVNKHFQLVETKQTPSYYDNTNGSLYKIAEQRGWNAYQTEIVKRIDRCLKKGEFKSDLIKTIGVIELWLSECDPELLEQEEKLNK